jgi:hypothetical protein
MKPYPVQTPGYNGLHAKYAGVSGRAKILSKFHSQTMAVIDLTIDLAK